jgi:hypothetical protein
MGERRNCGPLAAGLNERGIETACGGTWSAVQVSRVIELLE